MSTRQAAVVLPKNGSGNTKGAPRASKKTASDTILQTFWERERASYSSAAEEPLLHKLGGAVLVVGDEDVSSDDEDEENEPVPLEAKTSEAGSASYTTAAAAVGVAAPAAPVTPLDDSVRMWLREIGKTPLLNLEQEIALARKIEKGDEEAKVILTQANLRLVVSVAKRYGGGAFPFQT